jgi:hypothetical protein
MKRLLFTLITTLSIQVLSSQISTEENAAIKEVNKENSINCNPVKGCSFFAKTDYTNLYIEPNTNSVTIISPKKDNFSLICVEDGFNNDFIKVELHLYMDAFEEKGIDEKTRMLYYEIIGGSNNIKLSQLSLKNYFKLILNDVELRKLYNTLMKNNSFQGWTEEQEFHKKMKTFEGFKKYWIKFDKDKMDINYIIENYDRIVYVNKSDVMKGSQPFLISINMSTSECQNRINECISLKEKNSCSYSEDTFFIYFSKYIANISSKEPFLALQKINLYSEYFESEENIVKIEYLRMYAAYQDKNYEGTITTAQEIINNYKEKKKYVVLNGKVKMHDFINLEKVYSYLISSLIQLNKIDEAYDFSNECLANKRIQFDQFLEYHAYILQRLDKIDEMCNLLNEEYLKGNAKAKTLKIKYCK